MARADLAVLLLAAGKGTRMKSETAKVLHELAGDPLVAYPIDLAIGLGAEKIVVIVGHQAEIVQSRLEARYPGRLSFALQKEQKGTGHAVIQGMKALKGFDGTVLILSGDVPLLSAKTARALVSAQKKRKHGVVVLSMQPADPTGYGRIVRDESGRVLRNVEHKDAQPDEHAIREVNSGVYAADAGFLKKALKKIGNDNAQGEYYLPDVIALASSTRGSKTTGASTVLTHDPVEVSGVNDRAQLAQLEARVRAEINLGWMKAGVAIIDPATTYISRQAKIGADTMIHPATHIRGTTRIGRRCSIDTGSVLVDSVVHDDVVIKPHSMLESATVRKAAIIGPFARLRPEADVAEEAHVGNFVELKKTKLGRGSKANHLAYLGDSVIGEGANIGAGTITCNYDGFGKYVTRIGDGVFVGSNSTLVAPLNISKNAYVAAGSTITRTVSADSLAFGRAPQSEKKGRATRLRATAKARAEREKAKKKTRPGAKKKKTGAKKSRSK